MRPRPAFRLVRAVPCACAAAALLAPSPAPAFGGNAARPRPSAHRLAGDAYVVATVGSDASTGRDDAPWRTLQHAADAAPAGATVYVRNGSYPGFAMTRSGTRGARITFTSYPGEHATLVGTARYQHTVELRGAHFVTLRGLTISQAQAAHMAGVFITGAGDDIVERNVISHNRSFGVWSFFSTNVTIRQNDLTANDIGILFEGTSTGSVAVSNQIHDNTGMVIDDPLPNNDYGAVAIVFFETSGGVLARRNTIHGNRGSSHDYGYDGGAFEVYGASDVRIRDNVMWNNQNVLETGTESGFHCDDDVFTGNVASGENDKSLVGPRGPVATGMVLRCASNMTISGNTFDDLDWWVFDLTSSGKYAGVQANIHIHDNSITQRQPSATIYALPTTLPNGLTIDQDRMSVAANAPLARRVGYPDASTLDALRAWGLENNGLVVPPPPPPTARR